MIDWVETSAKFGYKNQSELIGKRPKVVCKCDTCDKRRTITIRIKSKVVNNHLPWACPSCISTKRSKEISKQMRANWAEETYRAQQISIKQDHAYRQKQSEASVIRWKNSSYRKQLETGIDIELYKSRSKKQFKDQFDYSNTIFGGWRDRIIVVCKKCNNLVDADPQKHIEHGFCPKCGISSGQKEIVTYLESLGEDIIINDRSVLEKTELDILLPNHKLAVEYHGIFWHSYREAESRAQRLRHQTKALECIDNGILLYQFFDFEWRRKRNIIESMLQNALGKSTKLNARSFKVEIIDDSIAKPFFESNHMQGHRTAKLTIAIMHDSDIMMAASFSRYKDGYEIIRLATKRCMQIRGGASRLIKHFMLIHNCKLYTFADLRYSNGNGYRKLGFKQLKTTKPGYFYTLQRGGDYTILSRQQCQKHKIHKILKDFDADLSESQNMFNNGYRRVWTAGNLSFVL